METRESDFSPENKPESRVEKELDAWDSIKAAERREQTIRDLGRTAVEGSK
jgi:hypothetical protein